MKDADRRPVLSCPASHIGWLHDIFVARRVAGHSFSGDGVIVPIVLLFICILAVNVQAIAQVPMQNTVAPDLALWSGLRCSRHRCCWRRASVSPVMVFSGFLRPRTKNNCFLAIQLQIRGPV